MAERGHSGEGPYLFQRKAVPSSAVPGPQGIPPEAMEAGSRAIYEMTKGAQIPVHGTRIKHVGTGRLAEAVIEAALPFLSPAKERLPAEERDQAFFAGMAWAERKMRFEGRVDSSPSPDREGYGANLREAAEEARRLPRGQRRSAALASEARQGATDSTPAEPSELSKDEIEAAVTPAWAGTPKGLELSEQEIEQLLDHFDPGFNPPEAYETAIAKLRDFLARRSGSPEGTG